MGGVFIKKIWVMDRYTFEYWQHSSRQQQGREKNWHTASDRKAPETSNGDLTFHVFSLEDAVAHLSVTDPSGILTIQK